VRERAQRHCEYCHADERWQFVRFTTDHVRPQSAGGSDDADNLALACRTVMSGVGIALMGVIPKPGRWSHSSTPAAIGGRSTLSGTPRSYALLGKHRQAE
jgi:hypothetical protein